MTDLDEKRNNLLKQNPEDQKLLQDFKMEYQKK